MNQILEYIHTHMAEAVTIWILLILLLILWNRYRHERRKSLQLEASVGKEREFYRAFAEEAGDFFLYVQKEDLSVQYVSPNFTEMTGISATMLKTDLEVLKKLFERSTQKEMQKQISSWDGKGELRLEGIYHRIDREEQRCARITISQEEKQTCYLVAFADMTEEYRKRQSLTEDLWNAQKESQSKTNFLSQMSHEIRTPMNGILGMLSLLRNHLDDPMAAGRYLNKTEELSGFLLTLINDILDISRIESGKMQLEQAPFDLVKLADKLDSMFRSTAEEKGIHWKVQMQDFDVRYVVGDEMRLSQVIVNFISNANKFTQAGGSVTVTFRQMDRIKDELHLMIRVRDTGKGIREDFINKIFRPFEQEDASTAHNYGGSGLGMAIADSIIKLMNGEILVESEEGKGSEFTVYLTFPIALEQEEAGGVQQTEAILSEEAEQAVADFTIRGFHILLAEDNDINAEIAMEILQMDGAEVFRAEDGAQAVQMFADSVPGSIDVILMDIQMPELNGWDATRKIRQMDRSDADLPIFAMSANAFVEDQRASMEAGMNGHINKPVDFEEVRRKIGEYYASRGQKR